MNTRMVVSAIALATITVVGGLFLILGMDEFIYEDEEEDDE